MLYKRFKFIKPFIDKGESVPVGSELIIMGERIYFNGYPIMPGVYDLFYDLIMKELKKKNYLRELPIPYNKV